MLTTMLVNYAAAPFMLLNVEDSLECFSRVAWYGYFIVGGSLFFFYAGGTRSLNKAQAKRVYDYQKKVEEEKERQERQESVDGTAYESESGSGTATPSSSDETHVIPPFDLMMAERMEKHQEKPF